MLLLMSFFHLVMIFFSAKSLRMCLFNRYLHVVLDVYSVSCLPLLEADALKSTNR